MCQVATTGFSRYRVRVFRLLDCLGIIEKITQELRKVRKLIHRAFFLGFVFANSLSSFESFLICPNFYP